MSDSDSFIQEVTDEVRRDRVFVLIRRYGWIAATVVLLIVGGAAYNEWRKAQLRAEAQAFGDALLSALDTQDDAARERALAGGIGSAEASPVLQLLQAGNQLDIEEEDTAVEVLEALAGDTTVPQPYSDLAALKLVLMGEDGVEPNVRAQLLERLSQPGAPFRLLALEQRAIDLASDGDTEGARDAIETLLQEPGLTQSIVNRSTQLLLTLGPAPDTEGTE